MFEPTSRYYALDTATYTTPDGRIVRYVRRRFLPDRHAMTTLAEIVVIEGDRLDLIAARTIGDAEQFWRICDSNNAMHPDELIAEVGAILRVGMETL